MSLKLSIDIGDLVAKKYKVLKRIGAGSFGTIFLGKSNNNSNQNFGSQLRTKRSFFSILFLIIMSLNNFYQILQVNM